MIDKQTLFFLTKLQQNNDRSWFEANRNLYENAKENIETFAQQMINAIAAFDPAVGHLLAKQCTYRINRDVRFSKNKMPYKNNMAIYINSAGKKSDTAGFYIHIQPGKSFVAAGIWQAPASQLAAIRQEIDYNFPEFKKLINSASYKKNIPTGMDKEDSLIRPPKGYEEGNPAIEFLKLKSFISRHSFTDKEIVEKDFVKNAATVLKAINPVIKFLNRGLEDLSN